MNITIAVGTRMGHAGHKMESSPSPASPMAIPGAKRENSAPTLMLSPRNPRVVIGSPGGLGTSPMRRSNKGLAMSLELGGAKYQKEEDELESSKYTILTKLGSGAYSVVWLVEDKETKKRYAMKRLDNIFDSLERARTTLREIRLLKHFDHPNIIQLVDVLKPLRRDSFTSIYMAIELCTGDLFSAIHKTERLDPELLQRYIYQMLRGLRAIHSAGVLHRDLKPGNLLLSASGELKISDFGSGRADRCSNAKRNSNNGRRYTELNDTTTVCYRAPEGLLRAENYTSAVDIWSVGCILIEMVSRRRPFNAKHPPSVAELIFEALGTPKAEDLSAIASAAFIAYVQSLPPRPRRPLQDVFPDLASASPLLIDLINRMLQFNPATRITAAESLEHPYFAPLRLVTVSSPTPVHEYDDSDESADETISTWRAKIYDECVAPPPVRY